MNFMQELANTLVALEYDHVESIVIDPDVTVRANEK